MKKFIALITITFFLIASSAVFAQEYADTTEYSFDDDIVEGDLVRPDGADIAVRSGGKHRSLIRVRTHFVPEMLKSVEDI